MATTKEFIQTSDVTEIVKDYMTEVGKKIGQAELTAAIQDFLTDEDLADYVDQTALTNAIKDFLKQEDIDDLIDSDELEDAIKDFLKEADLADYAKSVDVVANTDLDGKVASAGYLKAATAESTYLKQEDATDLATKTEVDSKIQAAHVQVIELGENVANESALNAITPSKKEIRWVENPGVFYMYTGTKWEAIDIPLDGLAKTADLEGLLKEADISVASSESLQAAIQAGKTAAQG